MKHLLPFLLLFTSCTQGQYKTTPPKKMNPAITGSYKMSKEHDPSGTPTLFVLNNNRYVIVYFGGAQVGNWKMVQDSVVVFTPATPPAPFELYGRHNPLLPDSLRMFFGGFSDEPCFISFGTADAGGPVMRRVFNESPNCMSYPNVHTFSEKGAVISFASQSYHSATDSLQRNPVYTFTNPEGYNDFIAYHFPAKESERPFYAVHKNKQLYFNQIPYVYFEAAYSSQLANMLNGKGHFYNNSKDGFAPGPLPATGEDAAFINELATDDGHPTDTLFYNPFYKQFPVDATAVLKAYTYNAKKAAYLSSTYTEGEENGDAHDRYNSENVLYRFTILPTATAKAAHFKINEKPLFHFTCGDENVDTAH